ncbi:hypothetical protein TNCV_4558761 [Trichonephila clavipes]|uniref:Uncharacterized protein n=1 Tax=Trichonephila clavipes TaxID=2585209 RepID=A0A8X6WEI8_TRICX|nr:hypothetical protein TNCV_4558761 [Trichonephila clavipes]
MRNYLETNPRRNEEHFAPSPLQSGQTEANPPLFSPQASLTLMFRPTEEMKGRADLAQPRDGTPKPVVWKRDTLPLGH